eukprot:CAMPEP_0119104784 /NCGR_PEP_ID=MMETSP1180-20130426/2909_1 /TAXON_ID=3052 ORGANISM="Chlamydomonas cf sp, Strain CCMP681" /NCGR_SAMPLE_ID=MMETSP1180 /ASSEMBLY_ACC=CAM_ASM_000741 /LENGTH=260 /DNA_ID=CAMNT_0007089625 /DNA_START=155 /DNA_END=938 /DNA_ORIENTATION=+
MQNEEQQQRPVLTRMGRRSDKIAGRKGKSDMAKTKTYGKYGKLIQMAARAGADPISNLKLADLMILAKELGVPKEIVDRNIKKAGDKASADFQDVQYEAYGPGGTGFIIECFTDNVNRSAGDVKAAITKSGCKNAEPGSVMFTFQRAGQILVTNTTEDAVFEAAMEAGADDVVGVHPEEEGQPSTSYKVFTSVEEFINAKKKLISLGFKVDQEATGLVYKPNAAVEVDDEAFAKCEALLDKLLAVDDVDGVYSNCDGLEI